MVLPGAPGHRTSVASDAAGARTPTGSGCRSGQSGWRPSQRGAGPSSASEHPRPNGIQPSIAPTTPIAGVSASNRASPSVQQDVGGEGQPRQPGPDRHHRRHRADHDLARVAEQFGARDDAHFGAGHGDSLGRLLSELPDRGLVVGLAAGKIRRDELLATFRRTRRLRRSAAGTSRRGGSPVRQW